MKADTRFLLLLVIVGTALRFAPPSLFNAARLALLDAAQPGASAWSALRTHIERLQFHHRTADEMHERWVEADRERRYWKELAISHSLHVGRLQQDLEHWEPSTSRSAPLIRTDWLPAAVLGESSLNLWREGRLLSIGATAGLTEAAPVVDHPNAAIDAGQGLSVTPGAAVSRGGTLVGKITRVGRWTSTVQWLTDPEFRTRGRIVRETDGGISTVAEGVVVGTGTNICELQLVDATAPVQVGDIVVTEADGADVPEGIAIGRILLAELPAGAVHWSIEIEPTADLDSVHQVLVFRQQLNLAAATERGNGVQP